MSVMFVLHHPARQHRNPYKCYSHTDCLIVCCLNRFRISRLCSKGEEQSQVTEDAGLQHNSHELIT